MTRDVHMQFVNAPWSCSALAGVEDTTLPGSARDLLVEAPAWTALTVS